MAYRMKERSARNEFLDADAAVPRGGALRVPFQFPRLVRGNRAAARGRGTSPSGRYPEHGRNRLRTF